MSQPVYILIDRIFLQISGTETTMFGYLYTVYIYISCCSLFTWTIKGIGPYLWTIRNLQPDTFPIIFPHDSCSSDVFYRFFWGGWILNHLLIVLTSLFTKVSKIATFFEEFFFGSFCWSLVHLWFHLTPMGVVAPCQWQSKNNDWNLGCEDWRFASWEGGYKHPKLHKNLSVFCLCVYSVLLSTNMSNEKNFGCLGYIRDYATQMGIIS